VFEGVKVMRVMSEGDHMIRIMSKGEQEVRRSVRVMGEGEGDG